MSGVISASHRRVAYTNSPTHNLDTSSHMEIPVKMRESTFHWLTRHCTVCLSFIRNLVVALKELSIRGDFHSTGKRAFLLFMQPFGRSLLQWRFSSVCWKPRPSSTIPWKRVGSTVWSLNTSKPRNPMWWSPSSAERSTWLMRGFEVTIKTFARHWNGKTRLRQQNLVIMDVSFLQWSNLVDEYALRVHPCRTVLRAEQIQNASHSMWSDLFLYRDEWLLRGSGSTSVEIHARVFVEGGSGCFRMKDGGMLINLDGASYSTFLKEEVDSYRIVINNKSCVFQKENDPSVLR